MRRQLLAKPRKPRPPPLLGKVFELHHLAGRGLRERAQIGESGVERVGLMKGVVGLGARAFALQVFDGSRGRGEGEMTCGSDAKGGVGEGRGEGERAESPKRERSCSAHGKGRERGED